MEIQSPASTKPRRSKRILVVVGIIGSVAIAALVFGLAYLTFAGHDTTGLEGTWRDPANPQHCHEFLRSGDVETWFGRKGTGMGMFPMARFATWRRDGQQITVRTERGWDFVGQLEGGTIRGKMIIRDETGQVVNTTDTVWRKE
jgi:hypothetical protein